MPRRVPVLESAMTSQLWKNPANRRPFVGGSERPHRYGDRRGGPDQVVREERRGRPLDLSGELIVQLGLATEELNRHWFERNTGNKVGDVQRRMRHPVVRWMGATLDGLVEGSGAVFEAKFMLPWSFSEEAAAEKYMAQHAGHLLSPERLPPNSRPAASHPCRHMVVTDAVDKVADLTPRPSV
jgi:predicted phage-related endonuclease